MRNYDLTLIFSPLLSDGEANDLFQQFVSFVQEQGGILADQRLLGKKPLLAPIRHAKEGYLAQITFSVNEEKLPNVEKKCKETQQILRFFLVKQTKRVIKKTRVAPTPEIAIAPVQKKEDKVDLHDIDEKLEEIFKTG
jgi:ribosomal protein S6